MPQPKKRRQPGPRPDRTRAFRVGLRKIEIEKRRKAFAEAESDLRQGLETTRNLLSREGLTAKRKKLLEQRKELIERQIKTVSSIQKLEQDIYELFPRAKLEANEQEAGMLLWAIFERTKIELEKERYNEALESVLEKGLGKEPSVEGSMRERTEAVSKLLVNYGSNLLSLLEPDAIKRVSYVDDFFRKESARHYKRSYLDPKRPALSKLVNLMLVEQKERVRYFSNKMGLFDLRLKERDLKKMRGES